MKSKRVMTNREMFMHRIISGKYVFLKVGKAEGEYIMPAVIYKGALKKLKKL